MDARTLELLIVTVSFMLGALVLRKYMAWAIGAALICLLAAAMTVGHFVEHGNDVTRVKAVLEAHHPYEVIDFVDFDRKVVVTRNACTATYTVNYDAKAAWPLVVGTGRDTKGACPTGEFAQAALDYNFIGDPMSR